MKPEVMPLADLDKLHGEDHERCSDGLIQPAPRDYHGQD